MSRLPRRALLGAAAGAAALALAAPRARAAWAPDRPVQVILPGPAGGGLDVMARTLLPHVQRHLPGASFVVVNRPAASGQLAFEAVAAAAPDGTTLGVAPVPLINTVAIERPVRYRLEDLTWLVNVVDDPGALFVRADSPFRSLADLLAAARAKPGEVRAGSAGIATDDHLLLLALQDASDTTLLHVPYPGTPPVIAGLLSGDLQLGSFNIGEGLPQLQSGALRALALGWPERWQGAPDVPTFREQGVDVLGGSARGIIAPGNLPAPVAEALSAAFEAALKDPAWQADAARLNLPLRPLAGTAYRAFAMETQAALEARWKRQPWRDG